MRNIPVPYLAFTLALSFSLLLSFPAAAQELQQLENAPESSLEAKVLKEEEDAFVQKLGNLRWKPVPDNAKSLDFKEVLKRTVKDNRDIELAREKIHETEAKQNSVESKRVLFFFKYFNSDYIEGAAESDVHAAAKHVEVEINEALMNASRHYYDLIRAEMACYLAFQDIQQGLKQLRMDQREFEAGNATSFMLMQTRTRLIHQYEDYIKAASARSSASLKLAEFLGLNVAQIVHPDELVYRDNTLEVPVLSLITPEMLRQTDLTLERVVELAMQNRPDLKELEYKKDSVRNLIKANEANFDRSQVKIMKSTLKQVELKYDKARQVIQATAAKAFYDYQLALQKADLAHEQLDLASTALRQVKISHKAGLSSEKDVLDTQVAFAQAQVKQANALIDFNLSQVQLLYETGLISMDTLVKGPSAERLKPLAKGADSL